MVFTQWWERWQSLATEGMLQSDGSNGGLSLKSSLPGAEKGLEPDRMGVSCPSLLCHLTAFVMPGSFTHVSSPSFSCPLVLWE